MTTGRINQVAVSWPATRARLRELRAAGLGPQRAGRANVCCAGAAEEGSGALGFAVAGAKDSKAKPTGRE